MTCHRHRFDRVSGEEVRKGRCPDFDTAHTNTISVHEGCDELVFSLNGAPIVVSDEDDFSVEVGRCGIPLVAGYFVVGDRLQRSCGTIEVQIA